MKFAVKVESFKVDKNLGYVIQQTTKDSTQEILNYFYSIGQFVIDNLAAKSKATWLNKDIVLFYKNTPIAFKLKVAGRGPGSSYVVDRGMQMSIDVSFPRENENHDVTDIVNAIVESGLGLSKETEVMPQFTMPSLKSPSCLKTVRLKQIEERGGTDEHQG